MPTAQKILFSHSNNIFLPSRPTVLNICLLATVWNDQNKEKEAGNWKFKKTYTLFSIKTHHHLYWIFSNMYLDSISNQQKVFY